MTGDVPQSLFLGGVPAVGVSPLSLPLPGEKLFPQDEELLLQYDKAREMAKVIFAPLIK